MNTYPKSKIALKVSFILTAVLILLGGDFASSQPPANSVDGFWKENFTDVTTKNGVWMPDGWVLKGKPGTKPASFYVVKGEMEDTNYLHAEANKASASLICKAQDIDLQKTPIMSWRWRATQLPEGGDGRQRAKDDQAIGIYVGTGGIMDNKSVSYRWDTLTPKGSEGTASYGAGTVKVKWITLRNFEDAKDGKWMTEERDVARDFKEAWGFCPDKLYISVSCNSQYTASNASADLDWIRFNPGFAAARTVRDTNNN
jgi:hypothetical protein